MTQNNTNTPQFITQAITKASTSTNEDGIPVHTTLANAMEQLSELGITALSPKQLYALLLTYQDEATTLTNITHCIDNKLTELETYVYLELTSRDIDATHETVTQ